MGKWKNIVKRSLSLLLSVMMIMPNIDMTVFAAENEVVEITPKIVDLGEFSLENPGGISFLNTESGVVDLKNGNFENWIDRIDIPKYGIDLYNTMVEYSDNDGENDLFISEEGFSKDNAISIDYGSGIDTFNAIKIVTLESPTTYEINYVQQMIRAVYDAFVMDHPEVFWLSGKTSNYQVQYSYANGRKQYDFYLLLKMHEGSLSKVYDNFLAEEYNTEEIIRDNIRIRDNAIATILNTPAVQNAKNDYELVKAFNEWLTKNNEYNTLVSSGQHPLGPDYAHICLSALTGNEGEKGPVCEGYAEAFKILCDKKNIPCVSVTGPATSDPDSEGESHAWNFTKVDGYWYAMDVTWNDPAVSWKSGKDSGYENENYLLVGSETVHGELEFQESHKTQNTVSDKNPVAFINGPLLSKTKYTGSIENFTIRWDIDGDGEVDDSKQYAYGDTPSHADGVKPADAQYTYTFTGWSPSITPVTGDKTYTAQFSKTTNKYTVSWDIDGDGKVDDSKQYAYGDTPSHADGVKPADAQYTYTFTGWSPAITSVTGDKTYTAQFSSEKIPAEDDITPPETPDYVEKVQTSASSISLSWEPSSSEDVVKYEVFDYITDEILAEVSKPEAVITGLEAGKEYTLAIRAVDEAGNKSIPVTFTVMLEEKPGTIIPEENQLVRISGKNRFETSCFIADQYKELLGVTKFNSVIVATGYSYADALSGSFLAAQKTAPILLADPNNTDTVVDYIKANLVENGKVYILGGTGAVPASVEEKLANHTTDISRLKGGDRFGTNIEILNEVGIDGAKEILVATGWSYADSLSASAVNKPIMLVNKVLTDDQKAMFEKLADDATIYILGGTAAVSEKVEVELGAYGTVDRVKGADRFGTSVAIAEKFFGKDVEAVTFAYGWNYPDGLCGGPLAAKINGPVLLISDGYTANAKEYVKNISKGYVFGGNAVLKDEIVQTLFDYEILIKSIK